MYSPIEQAFENRFRHSTRDARRIFHGRGHLWPGLEHINIDWYPPVVLITAYHPIDSLEELVATIRTGDHQGCVESIILQKRYEKGAPSETISGTPHPVCHCHEGKLVFEVHPGVQQNAGLFLDMQPLRSWLQDNSEGKNFLNLFAYTCSLSVAALAGGARQVVNVDMSKTSIRWGERNHALNAQDLRRVRSIPHNIFRSWGRIGQFGRYDLVVIDPPSRQRGSFDVEKNYSAVLKKLARLTTPGATVFATVNSPYLDQDYLQHQFQRYAPGFDLVEHFPASPDFEDRHPQKALKICRFRSR